MSKLIVVEGMDGVGKSTQVNLMIEYLKRNELTVKHFHFPYFDNGMNEYWGYVIKRYLFEKDTYLNKLSCIDMNFELSRLYGLNRLTRKQQILDSLDNNDIVICDRYTYSTMAFQVANLRLCMQKEEYNNFDIGIQVELLKQKINDLELNKINGMPEPDLIIYLDGDVKILKKYLDNRDGEKDIYEKDILLQEYVRYEYNNLFKLIYHNKSFIIKCTNYNKLYSKEKIEKEIQEVLNYYII